VSAAPVLRWRRLGAIALLLLPPQAAGRASAKEAPVFGTGTRLVVLHATVKNARGELVTDLGKDAFSLYEDGKAQEISQFRRDDVPVSLGLLIDNSGSMRKLRTRVERAALDCVRASNPRDEVFVLNFADRLHLDVPFTNDPQVLEAGIGRTDAIGGTALRDALKEGAEYLDRHGRRDRKVLLAITDGNDNASVVTIDTIRRLVEQHGIVIYAIGLLGEEAPSVARRAHQELARLTELSGGVAYYASLPEELDAAALGIARQIRSQYTIGFVPSERSLDGSYRQLRLEARGPERLYVQTRAGYRATAASGPAAAADR